MKRRDALATVCSAVVGFSGCLSTATRSTTNTDAPPTPLSGYECPPDGVEKRPLVCSHTVEPETAAVYLLPSTATVDTSEETFSLTLYNDSATELRFNPFSWSLRKEQQSTWERVEQVVQGDGMRTVSPDESQTWTLHEVVAAINPDMTLNAGTYTAALSVPEPNEAGWLRCVALFRLR